MKKLSVLYCSCAAVSAFRLLSAPLEVIHSTERVSVCSLLTGTFVLSRPTDLSANIMIDVLPQRQALYTNNHIAVSLQQ